MTNRDYVAVVRDGSDSYKWFEPAETQLLIRYVTKECKRVQLVDIHTEENTVPVVHNSLPHSSGR